MLFDNFPTDIIGYHCRTSHAPQRYALGPAFLDWESQPDGFRRFADARQVVLPLRLNAATPAYAQLGNAPAQDLTADALGLFLELALGVSAWKEAEGTRWPLRNNPSSGNLHPTEGWVFLPALHGIGDGPALYHYAPRDHHLEERCRLESLPATLPDGAFLLALSSIPWRESWKYGERAFRYCQHDVGHAIAACATAAACLGWNVRILTRPGDDTLAQLLGLRRDDACHAYEAEHPDLIAIVGPGDLPEPDVSPVDGQWFGQANKLSDDHETWPVVDQALIFTHRNDGDGLRGVAELPSLSLPPSPCRHATASVIRHRRSAQRMNKGVGTDRDAFFRMLAATMPDANAVPWRGWPWAPRLSLALYVHQVDGLEPGLYALIREPAHLDRLRAAMKRDYLWQMIPDCPLPLYLLEARSLRAEASGLSCLQAIAGHGAFSLGMLADFIPTLAQDGDWAYRRLHWEAGIVGQALYLEAVAAGLSGTGIGCFFDTQVLEQLGMGLDEWRTLYHFTIGEALEDKRISTLPAYEPGRVSD